MVLAEMDELLCYHVESIKIELKLLSFYRIFRIA